MPRLLLVDDNESIHKIAETLLNPTDIELVCAKSAKEAIHLVEQSQLFDAALIDTAMAEMDGWTLLDHLRQIPATMHLPIAMMAGVLDTVDPAKIAHAPIQGFLKKPVELRDLGERVHKLINATPKFSGEPLHAPSPTPAPPESDFQRSTSPLTPPPEQTHYSGTGFVQPITEKIPMFPASVLQGPEETADIPEEIHTMEVQLPSDLLLLTAEDLLEHPSPAGTKTEDLSPFTEIPHVEETLELEDLDLEGLQEMSRLARQTGPHDITKITSQLPGKVLGQEERFSAITREFPELEQGELDFPPSPAQITGTASLSNIQESVLPVGSPGFEANAMPDFGDELDAESLASPLVFEQTAEPAYPTANSTLLDMAPAMDEIPPQMSVSKELIAVAPPAYTPSFDQAPPPMVLVSSAAPGTQFPVQTAAPVQVSAPSPAFAPQVQPQAQPHDLVNALLADPASMHQLAKALASLLTENVLKEIAWEAMPELLERLQNK